ncbi:hypothetical protein G6F63_016889 [Rhizopus arrhizus]|nr:hypothetical protein G6F63_016889 [Rhizopus arrhizus]
MSQQLYAKLKESSKYYKQKKPGVRFEVHVQYQDGWEYVVRGKGNRYRLEDVNLFVVSEEGAELQIT